MKKILLKSLHNQDYLRPECNIMDVTVEGLLCVSNAGGNSEGVEEEDYNVGIW